MEGPSNSSDRAAIIFEQARQLAETAREAYLREACKEDRELRRLIGDLLAAHSKQGEFLAEPTHAGALGAADQAGDATTELPASALSAPESRQIGRYKLLQRIGEGGFGEVWMAEQREPIKRRVALKIIKPGMDSRQVIARFEAERQALAMMDHPNIARVFDAGVTDACRPYFVMELVRGVPITEYADTENLDPQARLELFALVCNAVQHAHQKGIIHRDLKPSNVLVTVTDGKPVPKVIDFGIAKATGGELTDKTLFTEFRQFIGTPQYMSPEQAGMSGVDIDTRSDIYSLGVLLYELLTGVTPFDAARLRSAALDEMRRIIREEDPPRPSTRVSTLGDALSAVARHRRVEPARLGALIRGDLDWITMKCLEKDRSRRYGTASDLTADVQRHLVGEAVLAAPPSAVYRMRKFVRKHKTAVLTASAVAAAVVLGAFGTTIGMIRAEAMKRDLALQNQTAHDILASAAMSAFLAKNPQPGGLHVGSFEVRMSAAEWNSHFVLKGVRTKRPDDTARQQGAQDEYDVRVFGADDLEISGAAAIQALGNLMIEATEENVGARRSLEAANARLAEQRDQAELWAARGQIAAARIALDERDSPTCRARLDACPQQFRNWEWGHLDAQLNDADLVLHGHKAEVTSAVFSPNGSRILTVGSGLHDDNIARMWDAATGRELFTITSDRPAFTSASFAPDGKAFLTLTTPRNYVNESFPSQLQVWDSGNGRELRRIALPEDPPDVSYHNRAKAAVSPDGTRVLWARSSGTRAALIDLQSTERVTWLSITGHFRGYPFSPDGRLVYTIHDDTDSNDESQEVVHVWDAATGEHQFQTPPTTRGKQDEEIHFAMFSADSRFLITNQWSGNSLVWEVATGTQAPSPPSLGRETGGDGSTYQPPFASCSPDGKTAVGLLKNHRGVRAWDITSGVERWRFENDVRIEFLAFSPDGRFLLFSDATRSTCLLSAETGRSVAVLTGESAEGLGLGGPHSPFSGDGHRLLGKAANGNVGVWDLPITPARTEFADTSREIDWSIFIPEKDEVAAALDDHSLRLYDAWTGREKQRLASDVKPDDGALGMSGRRLAIVDHFLGYERPRIRIWDLHQGTETASLEAGGNFKPDECWAAVGDVRFLGDRLLIPRSIYPDDSEDAPSRAELLEWDPETNELSDRFAAFADCARGLAISPRGDRIVFGSSWRGDQGDLGERTLVDAQTGSVVTTLEPWAARGWAPPATFSPDGAMFVGVIRSSDNTEKLSFWRSDDGALEKSIPIGSGMIQAIRFSPDGRRVGFVSWGGAGGGVVALADVAKGEVVWTATNPGKPIDNLDFTPDGARIVTSRRMFECGADFWDATDGAKVFSVPYRLGEPVSVEQKDWHAFSADGASLFLRDRDANPVVLHSRPRRLR